jgi:surfactin synthase thioesterase subunit
MITAQELTRITTLTPGALTQMIREAGHKKDQFLAARFLGITNGGQFCYEVEYMHEKDKVSRTKVFVSKHPYGSLEADY